MMKKFLSSMLLLLGFSQAALGDTLLEDLTSLASPALQTCLDNEINHGDLVYVSELISLTCENASVTTTGGIEQLTALTHLDLSGNELISENVNLGDNTLLEQVDLSDNQLTGINVDANTNLTLLDLTSNPLSAAAQDYLGSLTGFSVLFDLTMTLSSSGASLSNWLDATVVPSNTADVIDISVTESGFYNLVVSKTPESDVADASILLLDSASETFLDYAEVSTGNKGLLRARLKAGSHYQLSIVLLNGDSLGYTLEAAQPSPRTLSGRIIGKEGRPRRGISVSLMAGEKVIGQSSTNRHGKYSITAYGAPEVEVAVSDPSQRHATYYFSGDVELLSPDSYDEAGKGFLDATALPFLESDWLNINLRISGAGVKGSVAPGDFTLNTGDYIVLEFLNEHHTAIVFTESSPGNDGLYDFQPFPLAPDSRYLVRARRSTDESWNKAVPPFIHTGEDGSISRLDFEMKNLEFDGSVTGTTSFFSGSPMPTASAYAGYDLAVLGAELADDSTVSGSSHITPGVNIKGGLNEGDPTDVYTFDIDQSGVYEFHLDLAAFGLKLYERASESCLASLDSGEGCPSADETYGPGSLLLPLDPGTYHLEVDGNGASGAYNLHVEARLKEITALEEEAPSETQRRHVDTVRDPLDTYSFTPTTDGVHDFGLKFDSDNGAALVLYLKDSSGSVLNATSSRRFFSHFLDAGTPYTLEVHATTGGSEYQVGIDSGAEAAPPARFLRHPSIALPF